MAQCALRASVINDINIRQQHQAIRRQRAIFADADAERELFQRDVTPPPAA